ncbi:MAG: hypothetical protein IJI35_14610 [Kiritimatiellae bacterium]|nr:hypothetical protein [Eggerthellaceae bacterium]MBQ6330248.1 hypothetical protein [Kiritimatiellia bacterium]
MNENDHTSARSARSRLQGVGFGLTCPSTGMECQSLCAAYRDRGEGIGVDMALRLDPSTSGRCTRFDVVLSSAWTQAPAADAGDVPVEPMGGDAPAQNGDDKHARAEQFADECRGRGIELD